MIFLAVASAQLADLFTFLLVLRRLPIEGEANPLMRFAYVEGGTPGVIAFKLAALGLMLFALWSLRHLPGCRQYAAYVAIGVGLAGALINTLAGVA